MYSRSNCQQRRPIAGPRRRQNQRVAPNLRPGSVLAMDWRPGPMVPDRYRRRTLRIDGRGSQCRPLGRILPRGLKCLCSERENAYTTEVRFETVQWRDSHSLRTRRPSPERRCGVPDTDYPDVSHFEGPSGRIQSFENPYEARLYADVYAITGGFREEQTGKRGVPPGIVRASEEIRMTYLAVQMSVTYAA